ncbi:MAG: hypothetical protein PHS82_08470 [Lachnospiraceae bacterium]|nr:hypothetical protein [Lachnospiraceae bacterium]
MGQIWAVVRYNFRGFFREPRVLMTFGFGFVISFLLSGKVMQVTEIYDSSMQAVEPFLWTFGDAPSILICSLLLIFLFSDVPKLSAMTPFFLMRITKRKWLAGQLLYISLATGVYLLFIFLTTCLLCMQHTFIGNIWSKTAAMLGYSKLGEQMLVPSTVKVMESITPYGCMARLILLMLGYSLVLSFLVLTVNLKAGKHAGIFAGVLFSVYGYLLSSSILQKILGLPDWQMYKANVLAGWLSPLNHAVYARHSFGYDMLPTLTQSYLVYGGLLVILLLCSMHFLKEYNFAFLGQRD